MPNLDYDPQNPTDLLGQPIGEGDYVAWGTTYGRSAALCVSRSAAYGTTKRALFGVLRRGTGRKLAEPLEMLWVCEACVGVVG